MLLHSVLILTILLFSNSYGHKLKQVIVVSRHNIRAPITHVEALSPKKWPSWNLEPGSLTEKGRYLERFMEKYFSDWLIEEQLFDNNCPRDQVVVYANSSSRTTKTAESFVEGAFGGCVDVNNNDPIFNIKVRNTSARFKEAAVNEINNKLKETDLSSAYSELNRILDFGNSSYCRTKKVCDLNAGKSELVFRVNKHPDFKGPLQLGWSLIDWFLMAYYEGMALENVAWGQIETTEQWENLMPVHRLYLETCFNIKSLAKDLASPLLEYLINVFQNGQKKIYMLVGHDINILSLMTPFGFKDYVLHDQFENTPIGGKLVFQKWYDKENDQNLLKVNYMYLSTKQIRDCAEVSLQNPPQWQILEIEKCVIDENGFCPWNDFIRMLKNV